MTEIITKIGKGFLLELPLIKRHFDSIHINSKYCSKSYGNIAKDIKIDDYIIGITKLSNQYFFYVFDLKILEQTEYCVENYEVIDINIWGKSHSIIVFFSKEQYSFISDLDYNDFEIIIKNNSLEVKNKVLKTTLFAKYLQKYKKITNSVSLDKNQGSNDGFNLIDFYIFSESFLNHSIKNSFKNLDHNFFYKINNNFNKNKLFYNNQNISIFSREEYNNKNGFIKGLLNNQKNLDFSDFKKYLASCNNYNILFTTNNKELYDYFNNFINIEELNTDISNIESLKLDFFDKENIEEKLISVNKQIITFKYYLFLLENNYEKLQKSKIDLKYYKLDEQKLRKELYEQNIQKLTIKYQELLRYVIDTIDLSN